MIKTENGARVPRIRARDLAGAAYGVSGRYVEYAAFLKKNAPDLFEEVKNGKITIKAAIREHKSRKSEAEPITQEKYMITMKNMTEKEAQHNEAQHIAVDYPETQNLSTRNILKYKKALDTYPDLEEMKNTELILLAYDFRQEQIRSYHYEHTSELADGRSDIQLGFYKNKKFIPDDLPALFFEKECVKCHLNEKGINLCPKCWQAIREILSNQLNRTD